MYSAIAANKRKSIFLTTIFIAVLILLGWLIGRTTGYGNNGVIIAVIISLIMTLISFFAGDTIALAASGAKPIEKKDNAYLYRIIENLCITTGLPTPKIYVIKDESINAFATGRSPARASIAVTVGALQKLTNEELEGVLSHELSHIKNYDIRFMMMVGVMVGAIALLANMLWHTRIFRGGRDDRNNSLFLIFGIIAALLAPLVAELIKLAVSRRREFLADASGALITRFPDGLANALEKIGRENLPLHHANAATAHLFFSNPFGGKKIMNLFSTHPPVGDRVKALRQMAKEA